MRLLPALLAASAWLWAVPIAGADGPAKSFAVVELFGSQGCSSCPPADALLSSITADARAKGQPVFTMSFQVDYWDYLGWKDPFSNPAFTARQQEYAARLKTNVYTPEMIVNGQKAFVGSDAGAARAAVHSALNAPAAAELRASVKRSGPALQVSYATPFASPSAVLHVALVERGLRSRVAAGENAGRVLINDNVVRVFETLAVSSEGSTIISLPPAWTAASQGSIIVFIQEKDMRIIAAAAADVPAPA